MNNEMRKNHPLAGKKMLLVGMARSGVAAAELAASLGIVPVLNDMKTMEQLGDALDSLKSLPCEWKLGMRAEDALYGCDALCISPGVPIDAPVVRLAQEMGLPVLGELEFAAREAVCDVVALTGTNGKTTTTSLLRHIFETAGFHAVAAGNIGYPMSAAVRETRPGDKIVCEVSSFQLETTEQFHPTCAAVLNLSEDHLNRHGNMAAYAALKRHIFDAQTAVDAAVLNLDDPSVAAMAAGLRAQVYYFSRLQEVQQGAFLRDGMIVVRLHGQEHTLCHADDLPIPGPHNLENALAAALMACLRGVAPDAVTRGLVTFSGVEHRIEFVCEKEGVRYINDSKGTNVDSTVKAVLSMRAPTVLILGGSDKHVSFDPLSQLIAKTPEIAHCVLLGQTAPQLDASLRAAGCTNIHFAASMEQAVHLSRQLAAPGWNVLLSPACASFDMFRDYEERGRVFKALVRAL